MRAHLLGLPIVLLLAACAATTPPIEVTRFNIGQALPRSTVVVVAADRTVAGTLEFQNYASAVGTELGHAGFTPVPPGSQPMYIAVLTIRQDSRAVQRPSRVRVGVGIGGFGGGYRGGGGGGVGVSGPVGGPRLEQTRFTTLSLQLKRRIDETLVWEGRASAVANGPDGSLGVQVPVLAHALLADFPGRSGETVLVKGR